MWDHRYRKLKKGEVIKEGDEVGISGPGMNGKLTWKKPNPISIGTKAPDPSFISHRWYRRLKQ